MSRYIGLLTHNAPLKLAALALAIVLYGFLVFSQNVRAWSGPVPIEPIGQGADIFLLEMTPQAVTSIRFVAPADVAGTVSGHSFRATIDLTDRGPSDDGAPVSVPVHVEPVDPRIQVTGWAPQYVSVRLDTVITRSGIPVRVDRGTVPEGLTVGEPELSVSTVSVRGPASVVERVATAVARVIVDASGLDVDQDVDLGAVDARGDPLTPVDLEPARAHVRIAVGVSGTTRTVPVVPALRGRPAAGYTVSAVSVMPVTVAVSGTRATLEALDQLETEEVDIGGARTDVSGTVRLVLPEGVTLFSGSQTVRVTVSIVALTGSSTISVGIVLSGTSDAFAYTLSTGTTLATVSGEMVALDDLDAASLSAVADVSGLGAGVHTVPLSVALPSGITLEALSPPLVTVTIESAATPAPS